MLKLPRASRVCAILGVLSFALLVGCGQGELQTAGALATAIPSGVPTVDATSPPTDSTPLALPTPFLNPTMAAKFTAEAYGLATRAAQETALAGSPTLPAPTYPPYETPTAVDLPVDIIDHPAVQTHFCDCVFENRWRGRLENGDYINVFAGGYGYQQPSYGVILLEEEVPNLSHCEQELFFVPVQAGSVHVISADGLRVTLLSTDNVQFIFDAGTRTWISPPVTVTPPVTATAGP